MSRAGVVGWIESSGLTGRRTRLRENRKKNGNRRRDMLTEVYVLYPQKAHHQLFHLTSDSSLSFLQASSADPILLATALQNPVSFALGREVASRVGEETQIRFAGERACQMK